MLVTSLLQALGERLEEGVLIIDREGAVVGASPQAARLLRRPPAELRGRSLAELGITEAGADAVSFHHPASEQAFSGRCQDLADGHRIIFLGGGDGTARAQRALVECGRVLVRAGDEAELLQEICRIVVEVIGYRLAWIGFLGADGEVRPAAQTGFSSDFLRRHRVTVDATVREGQGVVGRAIRSGAPAVIRDAANNPRFSAWRGLAKEYGFRSVLGLPLIVGEQAIGTLALYAAEDDAFDAAAVALLEEVASDLAYGIYARRLQAENEINRAGLQRSLAALETQQQALDEHVMVCIADQQLRVLRVNGRFSDKTGVAAEQAAGRDLLTELWGLAEDGELAGRIREQLAQQHRWQGQVPQRTTEGATLWTDTTIVPYRDPRGEAYQHIVLSTDITPIQDAITTLHLLNEDLEARVSQRTADLELIRSELEADIQRREQVEWELRGANTTIAAAKERLEQAQNQLVQSEKMASVGQLAAGVAHEINNPIGYVHSNLNTLTGYVRDLLRWIEGEQQGRPPADVDLGFIREDLDDLLAETEEGIARVRKIVLDLREFSHAGASTDWQKADLHRGLESTLNIAHNAIKHRAEVVREYGELPDVECRLSHLNQVFINLFVNAAQAMTEFGRITVRTGHDPEADEVWIEVEDDGPGIPAEQRHRIFDAFYTTKPVGEGTGLGLSISYNIVQQHHGRISLRQGERGGACFRVVLPVHQPRGDAQQAAPGPAA